MGRKTRSKAKADKAELEWSKDNALMLEEQSCNDIIVSEVEETPAVSSTKTKKKETTKKSAKKSSKKASKKLPSPHTTDVDTNATSEVETCDDFTDGEEEVNDALRAAEARLKKLKQKKLRLQKIKAESTKLEKDLSSSSKSKHSSKLTTKKLRNMGDVAAKVDRLMDEKKLKFKDCSSSSSECSDYDSSTPSSCDTSDSEDEVVRKKKGKSKKKKKSGKNKKLTSSVKHPQEYPHSNLKFHFVGKEKKYDELSIAEFCAGYMSIVKSCERAQRQARIDHLEELMYHATTRPWKSVLNYHAACVLEIERGNLKWGDNFQMHGLQSITLSETFSHNSRGGNSATKQSGEKFSANDNRAPIRFCKNFQRGTCQFDRDHYGLLNNERHYLKHICGNCWVHLKKQSPHSEQSDTCPLFNAQL